jgi:hypothetical protein
LIVGLSTGEMVEGAMVGKDGVVGAAAALDSKIALTQAIVQLPGDAFVCDAATFKGVAMQSERLLGLLSPRTKRGLCASPTINRLHGRSRYPGAAL